MSALALSFDNGKGHGNGFEGVKRPRKRDKSPPNPLLLSPTPIPMAPRSPSPLQSDISRSISSEVSPLPSPALGPRLDLEPVPTPGARTKAFFGTSWKSFIPTPTPNTSPHRHKGSTEGEARSPSPKPASQPVDIPGHRGNIVGNSAAPQPSQTNDVFFDVKSTKHIPSPPSSIKTLSPDDRHDLPAAIRLHLARLSPGRLQPEFNRQPEERETHSRSRSSSHSSTHGFFRPPREFVYLTPESSDLSRSSSRSSVSGIRRDLTFTPIDASTTSSSPSNQHSSPLARLRQFDDTPMPLSPVEMMTPKPGDEVPATPMTPTMTPTLGSTTLVRRETQRNPSENRLQAGMVIGDDAPLSLVRLLGQGAFSSVWLARDIEDRLIPPGPRQRRRKSVSTARKQGDAVPGLRPAPQQTKRLGILNELDGEGAILPGTLPERQNNYSVMNSKVGKLVAVKLMDQNLCDVNDRTRISFVREVEVLRHISHPSIVAFLHSFTIPTHHCVVLEYVDGGELFELIRSDENYAKMTTPLLRRMWGELCRAVGWLHGVCIVHRDIKLENILLTVNPFLQPGPIDITQVPQPLIKLTDFGLARFIDPSQPMLTTRCGSETYAAPELVLGSSYDGRQTDAWACGIVLYALAVRSLPFDPKATNYGRDSRRKYFVRIAAAEYSWPEDAKFATEDLRKVVGRLLVRDPNKRAKIVDLWDEDFMRGEGAPNPPWRISARRKNESKALDIRRGSMAMEEVPEEETEDDYENGMLVDAHDIDSIASQELH